MERSGNQCVIKISGAATSMTAEATTHTGNISYQINNTAKRVLDRDTPPTVLDGGVATTEDYSVNYLNGAVTFTTATPRTITITGKYLPMTTAAYAHVMSHSKVCDLLDYNRFGQTNKSRIPGLKSASGTLSQFNVADTYYATALAAGVPIVLEILSATGDLPDRYWALLESDELQAAIDGVQDEVITWVSYDYWLRLGV